jgi:O-antigen ligase
MASTNTFPDDSAERVTHTDASLHPGAGAPRLRGANKRAPVERKKPRRKKRLERERALRNPGFSGLPSLESLVPVLSFLCFPALLVLAITATGGGWPKVVLYPVALGLGVYVALSAFRGVELVLACMLIYLPFSKVFVVPLAPGVNGTNVLVLLGLFAALLRLGETKQKLSNFPPGTYLVFAFAVLSSLSAITITLIPGGRVFLLYNELLSYKAWVDQFVFYFIVLMCVRDVETAKRCVVYLMLGSMLVVLYSVPEMLDKMGRSTIDKSRIGGPHLQSNNFGGFVAYTVLPLIAMFVVYIKDLRAWLLTPYFLLTAKVLITTFSRGAYLAMLVGGLLAGWYKGKGFLMMWLSIALCVLLAFPSLMPEAIVTRMQTLSAEDDAVLAPTEERLDKSSSTRLILWGAAVDMIKEDPIWGKGFKGYQLLKEDYTEAMVVESDPHSMYLYIGSQMGLPALLLFVLILGYSFYLGRSLSRRSHDRFIKAVGVGGAASTACMAVVCIFGSRAVSLNFTVYFWTLLVVMQVLKHEQDKQAALQKTTWKQRLEMVSTRLGRWHTDSKPRNRKRGAAAYQAEQADLERGAAAFQTRQVALEGAALASEHPATTPDSPLSNGPERTASQVSAARRTRSASGRRTSGRRIRNLPKPSG